MGSLKISLILAALGCVANAAESLPLYFEPNYGQAHSRVRFIARGSQANTYLLDSGAAVMRTGGLSALTWTLAGSRSASGQAESALPGISSYFSGTRSQAGVRQYDQVRFGGIYPGIDLVYYGSGGRLEYDFLIAPGADPAQVRIRFGAGARLELAASGDLRVTLPDGGTVWQRVPKARQGSRRVDVRYRLDSRREVSFVLGEYDRKAPLIVDPVLDSATYFGGGGYEQLNALKVDSEGNVYMAGNVVTAASDANPWTPAPNATQQAGIIKFSPSRNAILFFVRLGGSALDSARSLAIDTAGSVYVAGRTASDSFPTIRALQPRRLNSGLAATGFVTKIASDGASLLYSTYLGGSSLDDVSSIAVDSTGAAFVAGNTTSSDFPQRGAVQSPFVRSTTTLSFVAKIAADGRSLLFSSVYGGSAYNAASRVLIDTTGGIYFTGTTSSSDFPLKNSIMGPRGITDAFAVRLTPDGQSVVYSVVFGGSGNDNVNAAYVDSGQNLYIGGATSSPDLPVLNPLQGRKVGASSNLTGFIAKLAANGSLLYSTFLGGSSGDSIQDIVLDRQGFLYAAGWTRSVNFPSLKTIQPYTPGGVDGTDAFVARISPAGDQLLYSTLFGGSGDDYAYALGIAPDGAIYAGGLTTSPDLPVRAAYQGKFGGSTDMFLMRIGPDTTLPSTPDFSMSPSVLSFTATVGSAQPTPQVVRVSSNTGRSINFALSTSSFDNGAWLSASTASSNAFAVAVNSDRLQPGRFGGSVHVAPTDGTAAVDLPVSLTLLSAAPSLQSVDPVVLPLTSQDTVISLFGSGFNSTALASVSAANSDPYPLATTFVTSSILRIVLPANLLQQSLTLTITVANNGSATSNPVTVSVGRGSGPQISDQSIYGPSGAAQSIAPGEALTIYGANLGPSAPALFSVSEDGRVPSQLAETRVLFDATPAPVLFVSPNQVSVIVPFGVNGQSQTSVRVEYRGTPGNVVTVPVAPAVPGIFTGDLLGTGQASIINSDGSRNTAANGAPAGSVIAIYASGGGMFVDPVDDGAVLPGVLGLSLPVRVTIGGRPAEVLYAGAAPGLVAGILQINARIPDGVAGGLQEVVLQVGTASSQSGATVAVQ